MIEGCWMNSVFFHDRSTRRGRVVSSTPRPHFTPGKDPVPIVHEAGWAPGPVWTGGKSSPHRNSIVDRPVRSQSLYRLSYPIYIYIYIYMEEEFILYKRVTLVVASREIGLDVNAYKTKQFVMS